MSEQTHADRRRGDRRQHDRRRHQPLAEESWFGALGVGADTGFHPDDVHEGEPAPPPERRAPTGRRSDDRLDAQRQQSREARRVASSSDTAMRRVFRTYVAARAVLGLLLAMVPWVVSLPSVHSPLPLILLCLGYAAQSITVWLLPQIRPENTVHSMTQLGRRQWLATIGFDVMVFAALHLFDPAANLNFGALLVLPVLMAGVMTTRLAAMGTAAVVALVLLLGVFRSTSGLIDGTLFTQAGLAGIGVFMIALLAGEFSGRLVREEMAARGSLEIARQQAQLNRLVIEEMTDGVLVVDRRARVRAANPAARELLSSGDMTGPAPFALHDNDAWALLQAAVERAFEQGSWPETSREVRLMFPDGHSRTLQLRARFTRRRPDSDGAPPEEFCVVFLEDLRNVQTRQRQEKLAAMGRVSAGIAHEIRNPLAAIAQANALLLEDVLSQEQQQLARMVADNVDRLKRIVDDVMEAAPGAPTEWHTLDASAMVRSVCTDWARTVQLESGPNSRLQLEVPDQAVGVSFDPEHLRRVLVNLLDNAHRHGSATPGAIRVQLSADRDAVLSVSSDGAAISADVERHLFEPFFSTRSRGTGLGLYICRELCVRHGASIEFRPLGGGERHHNEFRVTMQRASLQTQETPSQA